MISTSSPARPCPPVLAVFLDGAPQITTDPRFTRHLGADGTVEWNAVLAEPGWSSGQRLLIAADHITFTGDRFTQLGQDGLGIGNDVDAHATGVGLGASAITATGNVFTQDAGGGIVVGGVQADAHHPSDSRMTDQNITLSNNVIHDVALDYRDMSAILVT